MIRTRVFLTLFLAARVALGPAVAAQTREGVKVRGHWTIEVHNPDGTLVTRREFDNTLTQAGGRLLAQYLSGFPPALWTIELGVYGGATSPCDGGTFNGFPQNTCLIVDPSATQLPTGTSVFPTLSAAAGPQGDALVLKGNATARVAGDIVYVATRQGSCLTFTTPQNCKVAGTTLQFTVHDLVNAQGSPDPLAIAEGQIVQVTVTLSFS